MDDERNEAYERMMQASRGREPIIASADFSGFDDIQLKAMHTLLDSLGWQRPGELKPYAKTLQVRLIWALHEGLLLKAKGVSDE